MSPEFLAVFLTLLMVAFIFLEFLTPSMGVLSVMALLALVGSVYEGYRASDGFGMIMAIVNLALIPVTVAFSLRLIRKSPMAVEASVDAGAQEDLAKKHANMTGKTGVAVTPLRPSGTVKIGDEKFDVITEGTHIEAGRSVRVVRVESDKIVVRQE